jgi:hypothetical protein
MMRKKLIEKGRDNIRLFSWDLTAGKFENLFLEIADRKLLFEMPSPAHYHKAVNAV